MYKLTSVFTEKVPHYPSPATGHREDPDQS